MSNYICRLNENVKREHVRYYNRYGIALAGIWRRQGTGALRLCKRTGTKRIYCADF